jgi:hypothetical protein
MTNIVVTIMDETLPEGVRLIALAIHQPMLREGRKRWQAGMAA